MTRARRITEPRDQREFVKALLEEAMRIAKTRRPDENGVVTLNATIAIHGPTAEGGVTPYGTCRALVCVEDEYAHMIHCFWTHTSW